ncbi:MAG TPA: PQQ-binding-like beta-propeller repeat protein [Sedimentisphaerales bacterium]|nr:PQQ-binding-like beta-propeller repeat protein [Sedimentisphaerales bacterium]
MKGAVLFLGWLVLALPCAGEIIIVDDGGYGDFDNIQAAINDSNDGDVIYVLPGTYTGSGNRDIDYGGRAITVTGVDPQDPYIVAATVVDCNSAGRAFSFYSEGPNSVLAGLTITNGYATLGGGIYCSCGSPTIIDCVISNSTATFNGGGMYCEGIPSAEVEWPSPIVMNCRFINNSAVRGGGLYIMHWFQFRNTFVDCEVTGNNALDGGGIYIRYGTVSGGTVSDNTADKGGGVYCESANLKNCTINGSTANEGGGIYCVDGEVNDCTISGNAAGNGGGAYLTDGVIRNCRITGNTASDYEGIGGGVWALGVGHGSRVLNCEVAGNSSSWGGGGLAGCHEVANCTITGNTASGPCGAGDGGGVFFCEKVINCIISGNVAADMGGGIYSYLPVSHIHNCTFSGNVADSGGAIASSDNIPAGLVLSDNILWGNQSNLPDTNEIDLGRGHLISANYNCIKDGSWVEGFGNIVDNPLFVREPNDGGDGWGDDPATPDVNEGANDDFGNLHLEADSPCVNTGDPCLYVGVDYGDIDGQPRIMGLRADMGADEFVIPMITVSKPQGGETWASGSIHDLTWANCMYEANVDIVLSVDDGNNWQSIEGNVPNTESHAWELPGELDSNQCVIAVVPSVPDPNVICIESGLFTIHPDNPGPPVTSKWKSLGGDFDRRGLSENYGPELGCVKWTFETGGPIPGSITIGAYDRVHIPCEDGKVYTLDANGVLLWTCDTNSAVLSASSVGPDGTIYVGTESGRLYAIDTDGNVRWTHDADGFIYSSPAVSPDGNSIYVCSSDGVVCALGRDGSVLWTFRTNDTTGIGSSILASPAVGPDGTVYVTAMRDPNLYALNANDGSVKWTCNFEYLIEWHVPDAGTYFGWPLASPVVGPDGAIYQALLYDPNLYAIDPNTGSKMWTVQTPRYRPYGDSDGWSEPAVGPDGTIYFGSSDANLWAVEPNGEIKWVTRLGLTTGLTLTVGSDGLIYAADNDSWLCVVDANGNELARFYSQGWLNCPVISADNTIIIADVNNKVWAIAGGDCSEGPFALHRPEDLDGNLSVNFRDFALLAADWPNSKNPYFPLPYPWPPYDWDGTYFAGDIDRNLDVDFADLRILAAHWLEWEVVGEPDCWDASECAGQSLGDGTCDGVVDFEDLGRLRTAFLTCKGEADYDCCADYNHDYCCDFLDMGILKANFLTSGYAPATGNQDCPP